MNREFIFDADFGEQIPELFRNNFPDKLPI
jgi:hypothetical protein